MTQERCLKELVSQIPLLGTQPTRQLPKECEEQTLLKVKQLFLETKF